MRNQQVLKDLLGHFLDMGIPGCALTVSYHGEVVFEHCEGLADVENARRFQPDTIYRAFSCTKPITAVATMILLERGKLLLTDPIERYLPYFANPRYYSYNGAASTQILPCRNSITIRHLMSMTSGLTYAGTNNRTEQALSAFAHNSPAPVTLQEFCEKLASVPLAFEPGTHWMYGYGCEVLGAIIEVVSGKTLGVFMREEIFEPLGMEQTGFFLTDAMRPKLAALYVKGDDGKLTREEKRDRSYDKPHLFESGGGGLLTNIGDMTKFSQMMAMGGTLRGTSILARKTVDLIRMDHLNPQARADFDVVSKLVWPNMLGYSFGLCCRTLVDPAFGGSNGSLGEFAWSGAAGTWALIDPELQISAEYAHQVMPPERNMQDYCHPRLRNAIYAALT